MTQSDSESEYEETDPRRDVHVDDDRYDKFVELQESEDSPLYQANNHDLFVFTVGYGRMYSSPEKIGNDEHAFFGRTRLSDAQQTVLEAVAIAEEETVEVIRDQRYVYQLAERYANAGIIELYRRVFNSEDDPLSELTIEINDAYTLPR
jgi:hypothetical protein